MGSGAYPRGDLTLHAGINVRIDLSTNMNKTLPLGVLGEIVAEKGLGARMLEAIVESLDERPVEAYCGEKHRVATATSASSEQERLRAQPLPPSATTGSRFTTSKIPPTPTTPRTSGQSSISSSSMDSVSIKRTSPHRLLTWRPPPATGTPSP